MARQDRIDSYEKKIAELQKLLKAEKAKEAEQKRKERTQRLIKIGAIVEKIAGHEVTDLERFETWLKSALIAQSVEENNPKINPPPTP